MKHFLLLAAVFAAPVHADDVAAVIGDETIMMSEVDAAGGPSVHELAEELYTARVQSLYQILTDALLEREAETRGTTPEAVEREAIAEQVPAVTEGDVDDFLEQQPGLDANDSRVRARVALFLGMQARSERKKVWMEAMFARYGVRVALTAPPEPPLEEIFGPLAPALGRPDAPVTIVSFSDYQCPFCRRMLDTLIAVHEAYPDTVQVVYRHYPLHEGAGPLAEAALCAGDQGRFWEYHLELFSPEQIDPSASYLIAERLGLDVDAFGVCLTSGRHTRQVQDDFAEGQRLQITGTPTSFINGRRLRGAVALPQLVEAVEAALERLGGESGTASF